MSGANRKFEVVHACWPIIHPPTFLEVSRRQPLRYTDASSSCIDGMTRDAQHWLCQCACSHPVTHAIRECSQSQVCGYGIILSVTDSKGDPSSAGRHYHDLFVKLTDLQNGHSLYELIAFFFTSQFFCTDNVPTPLAHTYFSIALSKTIDGGVHK